MTKHYLSERIPCVRGHSIPIDERKAIGADECPECGEIFDPISRMQLVNDWLFGEKDAPQS